MGLAPGAGRDDLHVIHTHPSGWTTILLVEQNANMALKYARLCARDRQDRALGTAEITQNPQVKKAYLGVSVDLAVNPGHSCPNPHDL
jgi:ABC-type branched-subunit amino acid transport system ATPase component